MKKILIVMGPPGCGKGTQAALLKDELNIEHISTGELFRYEISNETKLGLEAKSYINDGKYVPDELTISMLKSRIEDDIYKNGFILDGFPRTAPQAEFLDTMLAELEEKITAVLYYNVTDNTVVERIKGRAVKDKAAGREVRADDLDENIIAQRLDTYHTSTKPILSFYEDKDLLVTLDASKSVEDIFEETLTKLK